MKKAIFSSGKALLLAACLATPLSVLGAQPASADVEGCVSGTVGRVCGGPDGIGGCISGTVVDVCGGPAHSDNGNRGRWHHHHHGDDD